MVVIELLRARRAALAGQIEQGKAEYEQIERILRDKMRSIDMDVGGLKALDELLAELEQSDAPAEDDGGAEKQPGERYGATNGTPAQHAGK